MTRDLSWVGIWLLIVCSAVIVLEGALAGIWTARLSRRAQRLGEQLATEQRLLQADVERMLASQAEMRVLWQPYRRALRFLRHPLVAALLQSYVRRRAAR